jgi:1-acyl-sn-glycerol-3-phosphate acyltransferase
VLRVLGWTLRYVPPPSPKSVLIFYPHTSNWDFPLGLLARAACGLRVHWVGKHTLFRGPLGPIMRRLGGIPVDRSARAGIVEQLRARFAARDSFHVAIAPEGTRSRGECWKTGFYRLALAAGVPVGLGFFDYRRREIGIEQWLTLSGDPEVDLQRIAEVYADRSARHPEQATPIRFGD